MNSYDFKCKLIEEELKTFWPQWHVIRRLGGGAFGDVFEIYRENFGIREKSALKMIQINDASETYLLFPSAADKAVSRSQDEKTSIPEAFRNEIQIMEDLRGAPNTVMIEDFHLRSDATSTILFVRMELLTSFQQVMVKRQRNQSPFTIPEILKIGKDICTALMYCEKKGIIHRDIKPANLFIDNFGNYKIGDFGVSRRMDTVHMALTMTGIGTVSYMAPEVFRGYPYNNTVDIYALGLILYQLLNKGRIPFLPIEGTYTMKDIERANSLRLNEEPLPSLAGTMIGCETVDSFLDKIILKACAIRSEDRWQSAKEFYECLIARDTPQEEMLQDNMSEIQQLKKQSQQFSESESRIANTIPPQDIDQSQTMHLPFINDSKNVEIGTFQNNNHNTQSKPTPMADKIDPESIYNTGVKSDEKPSLYKQKREKPSIVIFLATLLVATVMLIFIGYIIIHKSRLSSLSSSPVFSSSSDSSFEDQNGLITDSWEEIIASGEDGSYAKKYNIGDMKALDLGEEGVIRMELVALDVDELADGSGKAHMTWIAKDLLNSEHCMNEEEYGSDNWVESDLREWLQESILPLLPVIVRSNIKKVTKYSYDLVDLDSYVDTIWIPCSKEIFGGDYFDWGDSLWDFGVEYTTAFSDNETRKKMHVDTSVTSEWWLRCSYDDDVYASVEDDGSDGDTACETEDHGIAIGFCL